MKAFLTTIALALLFLPEKIAACSCAPISYFCNSFAYENNAGEIITFPVYYGTVTGHNDMGMTMDVHLTYAGEDMTGQSILVLRGNGASCTVNTDQFEVGEELIITLGSFIENSWYMSICKVSYLKVNLGMVSGAIAEGVNSVLLSDFASLADCDSLLLDPEFDPNIANMISINPTLTNSNVVLKTLTKLPPGESLNLQVIDLAGREVFRTKVIDNDMLVEEIIDMSDWVSGLYFFKVLLEGKEEVFRVVKSE